MKDTEFEALANLTKEAWHVAPSALVSLVHLLCTVGPARARLPWSRQMTCSSPCSPGRASVVIKGQYQGLAEDETQSAQQDLICVLADCSSTQHSSAGGLVHPEICPSCRKARLPDRHLHIQAPRQVEFRTIQHLPSSNRNISLPEWPHKKHSCFTCHCSLFVACSEAVTCSALTT